RRRGSRTAPLCWIGYLSIALSGCVATKSDVRKLQDELAMVRARQDSLAREAARQNRALEDALTANTDRLQGRLSSEMRSLQELMLTVQQLLGQSQQRITDLREQLQQQQQQQVTQPVRPGASGTSADELYRIGNEKLNDSPAVARVAFQELLAEFPTHERAPDAQYFLAETFALEGDTAQAFAQFQRVVEMHPSHARAPMALYRAGLLAEEHRAVRRARDFYNRVVNRYRDSDAATQARERLRVLR
ncbi:MAG TPA: tetratricopeptide repeat protein, partial [Longimicrobiales bacterium]|nr:tetratricopeptide repeat protein [Longimicrobiales bacterium]